jgi:hypothetical protein
MNPTDMNCPILERTGDDRPVGRCWYYCPNGKCPRHGDVTDALAKYHRGEGCTDERDFKRVAGAAKIS